MPSTETTPALTEANPTIQQHRTDAQALLAQVSALTIEDDASLGAAAALAQTIARGKRTIVDFFRPMKQAADRAHKEVCTAERGLLAIWEQGDSAIRRKMGAFNDAREAAKRAAARQEEERLRREAVDKQIEDAVRIDNLARATGDPVFAKAAEQVLDQPITVIVEAQKTANPTGISFVEEVDVVLEDALAFVRGVAAGTVTLDEKTLTKIAEAATSWVRTEATQRGKAFNVPGWIRTVSTGTRVRL